MPLFHKTKTPQVWIGCLNCYNNGRLVGKWINADDAEDIYAHDLHTEEDPFENCEELWCFDTNEMPIGNKEMSPSEAKMWADRLSDVDDNLHEEYYAWVENYPSSAEDATNDNFENQYIGTYMSVEDFAYAMAEDQLHSAPEIAKTYFDYEAFARDLKIEYVILDVEDGIAVFE